MLKVSGLTKRFGGVTALADFDLALSGGEVVALIGPNGAGKTTLFNLLTGFLDPDGGKMLVRGRGLNRIAPHRALGLGLARTFQDLRLIGGITALDNVTLAFPRQRGESLAGLALFPRAVARQERKQRERALELLSRVDLAHKARDLARNLSYGQQKLLTLACVLATGAEMLLLDEPVAGVHPRVIARILALISELAAQGKAVLLIEHDMRAVAQIAQRIVFLDEGRKVSEGPPGDVLKDPRVLEAYLEG
jgi:ABC-type branched-subunit amino acid transport system ATPase component